VLLIVAFPHRASCVVTPKGKFGWVTPFESRPLIQEGQPRQQPQPMDPQLVLPPPPTQNPPLNPNKTDGPAGNGRFFLVNSTLPSGPPFGGRTPLGGLPSLPRTSTKRESLSPRTQLPLTSGVNFAKVDIEEKESSRWGVGFLGWGFMDKRI